MVDEALARRIIGHGKAEEYRKLISDPSKFLLAAGGLKDDLAAYFDKVFISPDPQPIALHQAIVGGSQLKFVITTNYDTLVETAYRAAGQYRVSVNEFC